MFRHLSRLSIAALVAVTAACSDSPVATETPVEFETPRGESGSQYTNAPSIADIVADLAGSDTPEFTILLAALDAAGLVDAVDTQGPITVFAPTDAAFGRLLELLGVTAEELLSDTELLTQVLAYHVAPGALFSGDVLGAEKIRTKQGGFIFPVANDDGAFIRDTNGDTEDAQLQVPDLIDIEASNGVIHVIDEVLLFGDDMPGKKGDDDEEGEEEAEEPELPTISGIVGSLATGDQPEFTILLAALETAGLVDAFDKPGQNTVFAPTDAAFGRLLEAFDLTAEELLADAGLLTKLLAYHVAPGRRLSGDVLSAQRIRTRQGGFVFPVVTDEGAFIRDVNGVTEDAQLLAPDLIDIEASNGIIHVIDEVLVPVG